MKYRDDKSAKKSKVFTQTPWQATINQKPQAKEKSYEAKWTPKKKDK